MHNKGLVVVNVVATLTEEVVCQHIISNNHIFGYAIDTRIYSNNKNNKYMHFV